MALAFDVVDDESTSVGSAVTGRDDFAADGNVWATHPAKMQKPILVNVNWCIKLLAALGLR